MLTLSHSATVRQPSFVAAASDAGLTPFMLGALDAQRGELCVPEMYYTKRGQICEYAEGFESVKGRTMLSGQLLSGLVTDAMIDQAQAAGERDEAAHRFATMLTAMIGDDEMRAVVELNDLQEGMADNDFWASGRW